MSPLDIEILEARLARILDRLIPILKTDCASKRGIKNYQRQMMRIKLVTNMGLIDEYEQQLHIGEPENTPADGNTVSTEGG